MHVGHTYSSLQNAVELGFIEQLGVFGPHRFQLDGDLLIGPDVGSMVNVSECTATKFATQSVFASYS